MAAIDPAIGQVAAKAVAVPSPVRTGIPVSTSPGALTGDPNLLKAAALGGSEGVRAYKEAQGTLQQQAGDAAQRAAVRAALIGGPEAQGFENLSNQSYGRQIASLGRLGTGQQVYEGNMAAAAKEYDRRLKAAIPLMDAQTRKLLAKYEVDAKAKQAANLDKNFPLDTILGKTEQALPGAQKAAADAQARADEEARFRAAQQSGSNLKPFEDALAKNSARIQEIDKLTQGGIKGGLNVLGSLLPGGQKAILGDKEINQLRKEREQLVQDNIFQNNSLQATRAYNELQNRPEEGPKRVTDTAAAAAAAKPLASTQGLARDIAINQMGLPKDLVYGKINERTLNPLLNAQQSQLADQLGPQVVGLAQELDLDPVTVATVMTDDYVMSTLDGIRKGGYKTDTWQEAQTNLADDFLNPDSENYSPETYAVITKLVKDLPWKKEKR